MNSSSPRHFIGAGLAEESKLGHVSCIIELVLIIRTDDSMKYYASSDWT